MLKAITSLKNWFFSCDCKKEKTVEDLLNDLLVLAYKHDLRPRKITLPDRLMSELKSHYVFTDDLSPIREEDLYSVILKSGKNFSVTFK